MVKSLLVGCLLAIPFVASGQHDVSPPEMVEALLRDTIAVSVKLTFDPQSSSINAFGLDFHYPDSLLTFLDVTATGTLTEGWIMVAGSENTPGVIRIGGFNVDPVTTSGVLLKVYFLVDDLIGESWLSLNNFTDDLEAATTTRGIFKVLSQTGVGDTASGHRGVPASFAMKQNYPNPFNPSTTIRYAIPSREQSKEYALRTTLIIYNLLGQEVVTLVDEQQKPGYYSVVWDGRDSRGQAVSSGVYIYRIRAGSYVEARRMLFLK